MATKLDHSPADIIRQLLIDLGLANDETSLTWPVTAANELPIPDNAIEVWDTAGEIQGSMQNDGEVEQKEGILIRVRAQRHIEGYQKANSIMSGVNGLDKVIDVQVTVDTKVYNVHDVIRRGSILSVGKETGGSKRSLFTVNAVVDLRQIS